MPGTDMSEFETDMKKVCACEYCDKTEGFQLKAEYDAKTGALLEVTGPDYCFACSLEGCDEYDSKGSCRI